MLISRVILAVVAVGALVVAPRSSRAAGLVLGAAAVDVAQGAAAAPAVAVVAPLMAFLAAALTLAALVERSGLAQRAAAVLAAWSRGSGLRLYVLVCALCAALTAAISLDGAVVLMVPLLLALARRNGAPFAPLFLGAVVVANAVSIAVPQGNPTNLVVMSRLGLSPAQFVGHLLGPGLAAAAVGAAAIAVADRRVLRAPFSVAAGTVPHGSRGAAPDGSRGAAPDGSRGAAPDGSRGTVPHGSCGAAPAGSCRAVPGVSSQAVPDAPRLPLSGAERHAACALAAATLVAWVAPLAGMAPWWPFTATVALALAVRRTRPVIPWRVAAQVGGLVIVTQALHLPAPVPHELGLAGFVALAVAIGAASALANNLPVSVWASSLLASGTGAYAATIGLAVGALATPQGSVATLIAAELAGPCAPPLTVRRLAPLAGAAVLVAALVLWVGPS